jgi:hypothetical protein
MNFWSNATGLAHNSLGWRSEVNQCRYVSLLRMRHHGQEKTTYQPIMGSRLISVLRHGKVLLEIIGTNAVIRAVKTLKPCLHSGDLTAAADNCA